MYEYMATIERWVDGDTVHLDVDMGFRIHIKVDARLAHLNTPELIKYKTTGIESPALAFVKKNCPEGSSTRVSIVKQDKYGRWLAVIYPASLPTSLNDALIQSGLAKPYEGEGPKT